MATVKEAREVLTKLSAGDEEEQARIAAFRAGVESLAKEAGLTEDQVTKIVNDWTPGN